MIAVDSNLLLRLFVDDEPAQHKRAVAFFESQPAEASIYVNLVVLIEVLWLLSRRYGYTQEQVLDALVSLISNAGFVVQREDMVMAAIDEARSRRSGFVDTLIVNLNRDAGCSTTMTFDRKAAARIPGMDLLK